MRPRVLKSFKPLLAPPHSTHSPLVDAMAASTSSEGTAPAPTTPVPSAGVGAASSSPGSSPRLDLLARLGTTLNEAGIVDECESEIARLRRDRQKINAEKRTAAQALRNAERKRKRLHDRAAALSTDDLLKILGSRAAWREKRRKPPSSAGSPSAEPRAAAAEAATEDAEAEEDAGEDEEAEPEEDAAAAAEDE